MKKGPGRRDSVRPVAPPLIAARAPAAVVAPLDCPATIRATLPGWLIWNGIPDALTFVTTAVIIASGVFITWREHRIQHH